MNTSPESPLGLPREKSPRKRQPWSLATAWRKAERVLERTQPADVVTSPVRRRVELSADPVERARQLAGLFADADMRLSIALSHGMSPEEAEIVRGGARLMVEGAYRRLAMLGLKSGEGLSLEPSDKLAALLERLEGRGQAPEPGEPEGGQAP